MDKYQTALAMFHEKFGFNKEPMDENKLWFRYDLLTEEMDELYNAINDKDPEEIVDALGDLLYLTIGTADLLEIDLNKAFSTIQLANMRKQRGIKPGREQSGGFDVIKPEGWQSPTHEGNHGILGDIFNEL